MGLKEARTMNGMKNMLSVPDNNSVPKKGSHTNVSKTVENGANGHTNGQTNGHAKGNGLVPINLHH